MNTTIQRYEPSGSFSPLTFVYAMGSLLGAIVLAGVYSLLIDFIPFIYINALLTLGFGFGLGLLGSMAISGGHCRNRGIALGVGLLVGVGGLGATYGWGFLLAVREAASEAGVPMMELAREVGIGKWVDSRLAGGWTVRRTEITGVGVMLIWGIEALIATGATLLLTVAAASEPYCEPCQAWTQSQSGDLKGVTREEVQPLLDRGDLSALLAMEEHPDTDQACRIKLQRRFCPQCANTAYLTVTEVRTELKNGKEEEKSLELLENAALTPKLSAQYLARFVQPAPGVAPVAGAAP